MSNHTLRNRLLLVVGLSFATMQHVSGQLSLSPALPSTSAASNVDVYSAPRAVSLSPEGLRRLGYDSSGRKIAYASRNQIRGVRAQSAKAEFTLVNDTSSWLSLFIDGKRTVSVPPGDHGTTLIHPGTYTFRAVMPDNRAVQRRGYVSSAGQSWTVSEE